MEGDVEGNPIQTQILQNGQEKTGSNKLTLNSSVGGLCPHQQVLAVCMLCQLETKKNARRSSASATPEKVKMDTGKLAEVKDAGRIEIARGKEASMGDSADQRTAAPETSQTQKILLATEDEARVKAEEEARVKAEEEARNKAEEEARVKAEEEARVKAEEEARVKAEGEVRKKAEEEARVKAEEEARVKAEEEARMKAVQEARVKAEEEARVKAEEEARKKAEEEARVKAEEEARVKAEEEARAKAEEEARVKAEEEARAKAEEDARVKAEEEARKKAEEEARVKAEEEARKKAEEEARVKAEEEARKKAEEKARVKAEEEERVKVEEARKKAEEEARVKAEEEARAKAEEEARVKAEEEAKVKAEEEARVKAEEEARKKAEEEARVKAEEEARVKAEEEARKKAEEEARVKAEEEARVKAEEEARVKAEEEARVKAEEEARVKAEEEEEARRKAEEEARVKEEARKKAEEARVKAEEEARVKAEEEARMKAVEEARKKAEKEARVKAEAEARVKAQEEARVKAEEEARKKAEEEARVKAEEDARVKAEEEARKKAEEETRVKAEEEARVKAEEEARVKAGNKAEGNAKAEDANTSEEEKAKLKAKEEPKLKTEEEDKTAQLKRLSLVRQQAEEQAKLEEEKLKAKPLEVRLKAEKETRQEGQPQQQQQQQQQQRGDVVVGSPRPGQEAAAGRSRGEGSVYKNNEIPAVSVATRRAAIMQVLAAQEASSPRSKRSTSAQDIKQQPASSSSPRTSHSQQQQLKASASTSPRTVNSLFKSPALSPRGKELAESKDAASPAKIGQVPAAAPGATAVVSENAAEVVTESVGQKAVEKESPVSPRAAWSPSDTATAKTSNWDEDKLNEARLKVLNQMASELRRMSAINPAAFPVPPIPSSATKSNPAAQLPLATPSVAKKDDESDEEGEEDEDVLQAEDKEHKEQGLRLGTEQKEEKEIEVSGDVSEEDMQETLFLAETFRHVDALLDALANRAKPSHPLLPFLSRVTLLLRQTLNCWSRQSFHEVALEALGESLHSLQRMLTAFKQSAAVKLQGMLEMDQQHGKSRRLTRTPSSTWKSVRVAAKLHSLLIYPDAAANKSVKPVEHFDLRQVVKVQELHNGRDARFVVSTAQLGPHHFPLKDRDETEHLFRAGSDRERQRWLLFLDSCRQETAAKEALESLELQDRLRFFQKHVFKPFDPHAPRMSKELEYLFATQTLVPGAVNTHIATERRKVGLKDSFRVVKSKGKNNQGTERHIVLDLSYPHRLLIQRNAEEAGSGELLSQQLGEASAITTPHHPAKNSRALSRSPMVVQPSTSTLFNIAAKSKSLLGSARSGPMIHRKESVAGLGASMAKLSMPSASSAGAAGELIEVNHEDFVDWRRVRRTLSSSAGQLQDAVGDEERELRQFELAFMDNSLAKPTKKVRLYELIDVRTAARFEDRLHMFQNLDEGTRFSFLNQTLVHLLAQSRWLLQEPHPSQGPDTPAQESQNIFKMSLHWLMCTLHASTPLNTQSSELKTFSEQSPISKQGDTGRLYFLLRKFTALGHVHNDYSSCQCATDQCLVQLLKAFLACRGYINVLFIMMQRSHAPRRLALALLYQAVRFKQLTHSCHGLLHELPTNPAAPAASDTAPVGPSAAPPSMARANSSNNTPRSPGRGDPLCADTEEWDFVGRQPFAWYIQSLAKEHEIGAELIQTLLELLVDRGGHEDKLLAAGPPADSAGTRSRRSSVGDLSLSAHRRTGSGPSQPSDMLLLPSADHDGAANAPDNHLGQPAARKKCLYELVVADAELLAVLFLAAQSAEEPGQRLALGFVLSLISNPISGRENIAILLAQQSFATWLFPFLVTEHSMRERNDSVSNALSDMLTPRCRQPSTHSSPVYGLAVRLLAQLLFASLATQHYDADNSHEELRPLWPVQAGLAAPAAASAAPSSSSAGGTACPIKSSLLYTTLLQALPRYAGGLYPDVLAAVRRVLKSLCLLFRTHAVPPASSAVSCPPAPAPAPAPASSQPPAAAPPAASTIPSTSTAAGSFPPPSASSFANPEPDARFKAFVPFPPFPLTTSTAWEPSQHVLWKEQVWKLCMVVEEFCLYSPVPGQRTAFTSTSQLQWGLHLHENHPELLPDISLLETLCDLLAELGARLSESAQQAEPAGVDPRVQQAWHGNTLMPEYRYFKYLLQKLQSLKLLERRKQNTVQPLAELAALMSYRNMGYRSKKDASKAAQSLLPVYRRGAVLDVGISALQVPAEKLRELSKLQLAPPQVKREDFSQQVQQRLGQQLALDVTQVLPPNAPALELPTPESLRMHKEYHLYLSTQQKAGQIFLHPRSSLPLAPASASFSPLHPRSSVPFPIYTPPPARATSGALPADSPFASTTPVPPPPLLSASLGHAPGPPPPLLSASLGLSPSLPVPLSKSMSYTATDLSFVTSPQLLTRHHSSPLGQAMDSVSNPPSSYPYVNSPYYPPASLHSRSNLPPFPSPSSLPSGTVSPNMPPPLPSALGAASGKPEPQPTQEGNEQTLHPAYYKADRAHRISQIF